MTDFARIDGGVTAPAGFTTAGVAAGIKTSGALDLALIVSDRAAVAAGVFTTNKAVAAPVIVSREHLQATGGRARVVVVNAGCANACTGEDGLRVARGMAAAAATAVGVPAEEALVASTGVIGVGLDLGKVSAGIAAAHGALGRESHHADAARAIMTTDPFPKECAVRVTTPAGTFTVGGMCKGSGMIEPMMATMLGFVTTDAAVEPSRLQRALAEAVRVTFNAITVDGECSTNDSVFLLANGASGVEIDEPLHSTFVSALRRVCHELALGIVRGGEGATKLVAITVSGAASDADARLAARVIANSPLVKTAIHGADPNWGRLIAAAGRSGAAFNLDRAGVHIANIVLFENGRPHDENAAAAGEYLTGKELQIEVNLGTGGSHQATIWTCDLSAEYVRINGEYRT